MRERGEEREGEQNSKGERERRRKEGEQNSKGERERKRKGRRGEQQR